MGGDPSHQPARRASSGSGGVPRELRLMAAQGALPLKPADLIELLHHLLRDADAAIRAAAREALGGIAGGGAAADPQGPGHARRRAGLGGRARERARSCARRAAEHVAARRGDRGARRHAAGGAGRARRHQPGAPAAAHVAAGGARERTRASATTRSAACASCARRSASASSPRPPLRRPPPRRPRAAGPPSSRPTSRRPGGRGRDHGGRGLVRTLSEDERQETEKVSAVQKIYRMNTAEKVITALKGSREERAILVRDPNRIVATAVLGSPRLTEAEIESLRGHEERLRGGPAHDRQPRTGPSANGVVANLVKNPRTPIGIALNFVPRLNPRDMKGIAVDRNVPEAIRKQAQKFVAGPAAAADRRALGPSHGRLLRDPRRHPARRGRPRSARPTRSSRASSTPTASRTRRRRAGASVRSRT